MWVGIGNPMLFKHYLCNYMTDLIAILVMGKRSTVYMVVVVIVFLEINVKF